MMAFNQDPRPKGSEKLGCALKYMELRSFNVYLQPAVAWRAQPVDYGVNRHDLEIALLLFLREDQAFLLQEALLVVAPEWENSASASPSASVKGSGERFSFRAPRGPSPNLIGASRESRKSVRSVSTSDVENDFVRTDFPELHMRTLLFRLRRVHEDNQVALRPGEHLLPFGFGLDKSFLFARVPTSP